MAEDLQLLRHLRDLRKRRGKYRSTAASARELARLRSLLPAHSIEREVFDLAEVGGASYKEIASHLNVSERHLYRVRTRMMQILEAAETELSARARLTNTGPSELIATLLKYGHVHRAATALRRYDAVDVGARDRLELLVFESHIACHSGDFDKSARCIAQAKTLAGTLTDGRGHPERRIAMAEAHMAYGEGLYQAAIAKCEAGLAPFLSGTVDANELRSVVRDVTFLGMIYQESSSPHRAIELLDYAETLLARSAEPCGAELAAICVHRGFAWSTLPDGLAKAEQHAQRAVEIAAGHGLCFEAVWARLSAAIVHYVAGRAPEALVEALHALDFGRAVLSGDPLLRTHFITSRIEIFAGEVGETLDHLSETAGLVRPDSLMATIGYLVEARVHETRGDAPSTIAAATKAIDGFVARDTTTHYLGGGYLTRALAGARLGLDVRDDAQRALALLENGGFVPDQESARRLLHQRGA